MANLTIGNVPLCIAWERAANASRLLHAQDEFSLYHQILLEGSVLAILRLSRSAPVLSSLRSLADTFPAPEEYREIMVQLDGLLEHTFPVPDEFTDDDWHHYLAMVEHYRQGDNNKALHYLPALRERHPGFDWAKRARYVAGTPVPVGAKV